MQNQGKQIINSSSVCSHLEGSVALEASLQNRQCRDGERGKGKQKDPEGLSIFLERKGDIGGRARV